MVKPGYTFSGWNNGSGTTFAGGSSFTPTSGLTFNPVWTANVYSITFNSNQAAINDFMTKEWGPEVVTGWSHWVDEAQPTGDLLGEAALGAAAGQVLVCDTTSVNFYQLCLAAIHARPGRKTIITCLLYTSPRPRDRQKSRMPSSA